MLSGCAAISLGRGGVIRFAVMRLLVFCFLVFAVPCVGLQCVLVALPGHTHFLKQTFSQYKCVSILGETVAVFIVVTTDLCKSSTSGKSVLITNDGLLCFIGYIY